MRANMIAKEMRQLLGFGAALALVAGVPAQGRAQATGAGAAAAAERAERAARGVERSLRPLRGMRVLGGGELGALGALGSLEGLEGLKGLEGRAALGSLEGLLGLQGLSGLQGLAALEGLADIGSGYDSRRFDARGYGELDQGTDSLYRQARDLMNRGDYKRAADLFRQVASRAPRSSVAGDALYWQAYSLYRSGNSSELSNALASLTRLEREYPQASARGDAGTLRMRICGELAKRGDEACAAQVTSTAREQGRHGREAVREGSGSAEQGCPKDDDDERVAALNALLQMDSERALPILERVLSRRDRCSATLRRKAVFLVSQKGDARAADILMGAVRNDPDEEVREQAVFWLGQTRDVRAVDMLQEILQKETNNEVLGKAVFALSQHRSGSAATILRDLAQRDGAPLQVREQAIFWLGQQQSGDNAALLRSLYGRVNEEQLKEKIIFSLSQNRGQGNDRFLLDVALDEKESMEMRKKALFWVGQSRSTSLDDLASLYNKIADREIKEQIIFVYSQRREPAAVDKLMEIAKSEKDRELRKKAVFWLSQSRDPRVAKFLEDIIG